MQVYLPIAEIAVDVFVLLGLGAMVGFLSGLFGIGGGFLMTPFLIFIGVPPAVAVATQNNQSIASSISGMIAHWRRGNVDIQLGGTLLMCSLVGAVIGIWGFGQLKKLGQIDLVISITYSALLTCIGAMMFIESARTYFKNKRNIAADLPLHQRSHELPKFMQALPFVVYFKKSDIRVSVLALLLMGIIMGALLAMMGLFSVIMVPAMFYVLKVPGRFVAGTNLFQAIFVASMVTFLHAIHYQTVDVMLALFLILGGIVGAPIGAYLASFLRGEYLRVLLAVLLLAVSGKLLFDMTIRPPEFFVVTDLPYED